MQKVSFIVFVFLLLAVACFFAFSGTGDYEYEGYAGEPDTLSKPMQTDTVYIKKGNGHGSS